MENKDSIEALRAKVKPLYENSDLLGFSVLNDYGGMIHNESFLSDEASRASTSVFMECRQNMLRSNRKLNRFIVELDDIALIYCLTDAGHTLFTLDGECDLDEAARLLVSA